MQFQSIGRRFMKLTLPVAYTVGGTTMAVAAPTLGTTISSIPFDAWLAVFAPSTFAAFVILALRFEKETPKRLGYVIFSQMMSSWGAGLLAFMVAEWQQVENDMFEVLIILVAALAGARVIEPAIQWGLARIFPTPSTSSTSASAQQQQPPQNPPTP